MKLAKGSVMLKGVEHSRWGVSIVDAYRAKGSVMLKGVEHCELSELDDLRYQRKDQ